MKRRSSSATPAEKMEEMNFCFDTTDEDNRPLQRQKSTAPVPSGRAGIVSTQLVIYDWPVYDLKTLCTRMEEASLRLPRLATTPYNKVEARMDWNEVAFGERTAEECRVKWQQISANVRNFRTISEMLTDTQRWLESKPRKAKLALTDHPDKPTRPASIFIRYMASEIPNMKAKYPSMGHRDIVRKIGETYKTISPARITQMKAEYQRESDEYLQRLEKFYAEHPEAAPYSRTANSALGNNGTAFMHFVEEKIREPNFANATKNELRATWNKLSDEKKIAYIEAALDTNRRAESQSSTLMPKATCDVLSKDERELYDRFLGKPTRPPATGFALFKSIASVELKDLNAVERNKEYHDRWSLMSRAEQNKFNNEIKLMRQSFDNDMVEYLKRLKQREQLLIENGPGICVKMPATLSNGKADSGSPRKSHLLSASAASSTRTAPVTQHSASRKRKMDITVGSDEEIIDAIDCLTTPSKPQRKYSQTTAFVTPGGKMDSLDNDKMAPRTRGRACGTPAKVSQAGSSRITALSCYQERELENWREINPGLSDKQLLKSIAAAFDELPAKKKAKWAAKAEKRLQRMMNADGDSNE